jgi:Bacterial mobilisation protein (MobC)
MVKLAGDCVVMARYNRSYTGEKRTAKVTVQLTPTERSELKREAAMQGAPNLSIYARELLFRRAATVVAGTRRNPEAADIMRALTLAGRELNANGNNLNQIARHLNTTGDLRDWPELREALGVFRHIADELKSAVSRVLDL